jgi:hypothetical protein
MSGISVIYPTGLDKNNYFNILQCDAKKETKEGKKSQHSRKTIEQTR